MLRRRRRPRDEFPSTELEMTPMIDVTFLLLVFFLCTLQFKTLEGKLAAYLPSDVGPNVPTSISVEPIEIRVEVPVPGTRLDPFGGGRWSGEGRFTFGPDRRVAYLVGPRRFDSVAEAADRLATLHRASPERRIQIHAGEGTVYADAVAVIDAAARAGVTDIRFTALRD